MLPKQRRFGCFKLSIVAKTQLAASVDDDESLFQLSGDTFINEKMRSDVSIKMIAFKMQCKENESHFHYICLKVENKEHLVDFNVTLYMRHNLLATEQLIHHT